MNFKFENIDIKAIYSTAPTQLLNFNELYSLFSKEEIDKITKVTGINSVRIAANNTTSSDLCEFSANQLLKDLSIDPHSIDGLIFVSQTRDYIMPQTSNVLHKKLGLSNKTVCFDLPLGCSGYVNGLFQASLLIEAGCNNVLVLVGDTTSKIINPRDRANRLVFGDLGSATLLKKGDNSIGFSIYNDGSGFQDLIIPVRGHRLPSDSKTKLSTADEDGNYRSKDDLYMNGMNVFSFVISKVPKLLKEIINESPYSSFDTVDRFYLHQANKFMIDYLRKKLKISEDKMPVIVDGYGNTGPSSIPLLISLLSNKKTESTNKKNNILMGFGIGLSWAACYVDLQDTKIKNTENYG